MPSRVADVVVIGGGIVGTSIAYHLARRGCRRVVVLERDLVGSGATGKCNGGVRLQFASPLSIALSLEAIRAFETFRDEFGVDPEFRQHGYLFLITEASELARFRQLHAVQRALGVPVELLGPAEVRGLVPALEVGEILGGSYCGRDGFADPNAVVQGVARRARELGAEIREGVTATGIRADRGRVQAVETPAGPVATGWVVNAGGPWAGLVGRLAGITVPVQPYRRSQFVTGPFAGVRDPMPLVIEPALGFSFRKEGPGVLMGMTKPEPPGQFDDGVDWGWLPHVIERAVRWLPALAEAQVVRGYAGLYDLSPDWQPIIGPTGPVDGLLCCSGFSGHGFMHGLPAGRLVAEWILDGRPSVDLAAFSPDRFRRGAAAEREPMSW